MAVVCIIGMSPQGTGTVARVLEASGMVLSQWPVHGGSAALQQLRDFLEEQTHAEAPQWPDATGIGLLTVGQEVDSRLRFVFVSASPANVLANSLLTPDRDGTVQECLHAWHRYHEQLLRSYHRHASISILVDGDECAAVPDAFVRHCSEKWGLPLNVLNEFAPCVISGPGGVARFVAEQLSKDDRRCMALQYEIEASLVPLSEKPAWSSNVLSGQRFQYSLSDYRALLTQAGAAQENAVRNLENRVAEATRENELLLSQLYHLQVELEASKSQSGRQTENVETISAQLNMVEHEEALLQAQLNQVQDELERQFHQYQDAHKALETYARRFKRIMEVIPDYSHFESLEALSSGGSQVTWRLNDFEAAGRYFPELVFRTDAEGEIAGISLLVRAAMQDSVLLKRLDGKDRDHICLCSPGSARDAPRWRESLGDLSTSDWNLLRTLAKVTTEALERPGAVENCGGIDVKGQRLALAKLGDVLANFPETFRYDRASLKREQVNPDYEHLWLRFEEVSLNGKRWPEFEVRLSCAHVGPDYFGYFPKLEFPERSSQAPFENWFVEATDDFGVKLELRFALPDLLDMDVWWRVVPKDRAFILALVDRLPAVLETLRERGIELRRNWQDWIHMAREMQRIAALRGKEVPIREKSFLRFIGEATQRLFVTRERRRA